MQTAYFNYKNDDYGKPLRAKVCWSDEPDVKDEPSKPIGTYSSSNFIVEAAFCFFSSPTLYQRNT